MTASHFAAGPTASLATAMESARAAPVRAPRPTGDEAAARAAAEQFEAVFIAQMLQPMFAGLSTDGPFGGGRGEEIFRGQLLDQYGRMIATNGGLGISDALTRDIMSLQEV